MSLPSASFELEVSTSVDAAATATAGRTTRAESTPSLRVREARRFFGTCRKDKEKEAGERNESVPRRVKRGGRARARSSQRTRRRGTAREPASAALG